MIYIRDDDVLVGSAQHKDPVGRFVGVHKMIKKAGCIHVPTILCTEIMEFPEVIQYIRKEQASGSMAPQFHGLRHIDYGHYTTDEAIRTIKEGQDWFLKHLGMLFDQWMTPWGADTKDLRQACRAMNIELINCTNLVHPKDVVNDRNFNKTEWEGKSIFIHWWEKGLGRFQKCLDKLA